VTNHSTSIAETDAQSEDMSIGEKLRQARESASYSVAYVAAQTHLQEEVIVALETDQFDKLPGEVFVKGYIRSYAKLLEIDSQELLAAYPSDRSIETETVVPQIKKAKKLNSSGVDSIVIWSSVTVVVILTGLLMTWWVYQEDSDPVELATVAERFDDEHLSGASDVQEQQQPEAKQHDVVLGDIDPKHTSDKQNEPPGIVDNDQSIPQQQAQVAPAIIEAPFSGGEIDKVRITVKYTQESWTEIFDARKRRLLHGLIKPGATRVISGQAPFNIFLGNSPGVELEINGKPFDHSVYMRRNNTARFLIDDSNS
jgi:cytoskeleton protein RodZ